MALGSSKLMISTHCLLLVIFQIQRYGKSRFAQSRIASMSREYTSMAYFEIVHLFLQALLQLTSKAGMT